MEQRIQNVGLGVAAATVVAALAIWWFHNYIHPLWL